MSVKWKVRETYKTFKNASVRLLSALSTKIFVALCPDAHIIRPLCGSKLLPVGIYSPTEDLNY
jgi:hypothetical protein